MLTPGPRRQALEERILEDLVPLGYRGTAGSGSALGDGDVKAVCLRPGMLQFGFECKDRRSQSHHGVPTADWKKAQRQIRAAGFDPVFVTRNDSGTIMAHLEWNDFLTLLQQLLNKD